MYFQHNRKQIFCALGLIKQTQHKKTGSYLALGANLTVTYGWDRNTFSYINWNPQTLVRVAYSYMLSTENNNEITTITNLQTYAQNVIYNIPLIRGREGKDVSNTSVIDNKRLYFYTQMWIPCTVASG